MALISTDDIAHLGAKNAAQMVEDFTAEVSRFAPCLTAEPATVSASDLAYAKSIVRKAIERWHDMRSQMVASEAAGRQSYTTRPAQLPRYATERFTEREISDLAALCGAEADVTIPGMSRASFPEPLDYDALFSRPPRRLS